jgi:hypothetical protein
MYCGGDPFEPDHATRCDGRQGGRDDDPPPRPRKIKRDRDTSVRAFYNAVAAGKITTRRAQVWATLSAIGVSTTNEVHHHMRRVQKIAVDRVSVTPRFAELRDLGLIREVTERPCSVTGEICITWRAIQVSEHTGLATIHRCHVCHQIVSREVPQVARAEGGE